MTLFDQWKWKISKFVNLLFRKVYYIIFYKCKDKERRDQIIRIKILTFLFIVIT